MRAKVELSVKLIRTDLTFPGNLARRRNLAASKVAENMWKELWVMVDQVAAIRVLNHPDFDTFCPLGTHFHKEILFVLTYPRKSGIRFTHECLFRREECLEAQRATREISTR